MVSWETPKYASGNIFIYNRSTFEVPKNFFRPNSTIIVNSKLKSLFLTLYTTRKIPRTLILCFYLSYVFPFWDFDSLTAVSSYSNHSIVILSINCKSIDWFVWKENNGCSQVKLGQTVKLFVSIFLGFVIQKQPFTDVLQNMCS